MASFDSHSQPPVACAFSRYLSCRVFPSNYASVSRQILLSQLKQPGLPQPLVSGTLTQLQKPMSQDLSTPSSELLSTDITESWDLFFKSRPAKQWCPPLKSGPLSECDDHTPTEYFLPRFGPELISTFHSSEPKTRDVHTQPLIPPRKLTGLHSCTSHGGLSDHLFWARWAIPIGHVE